MSAEEIGDRARSQGIKIVAWTLPCFYLLGREMLINWGAIKTTDAIEDVIYVLDFWKRFQLSWHRNNGNLTNRQAGHRAQVMPEQKLQVFHADAFECREGDALHTAAQGFMATVAQYGFLVSCESRLTIHNHGPYKIADNREMLGARLSRAGRVRLSVARWCRPGTSPITISRSPWSSRAATSTCSTTGARSSRSPRSNRSTSLRLVCTAPITCQTVIFRSAWAARRS